MRFLLTLGLVLGIATTGCLDEASDPTPRTDEVTATVPREASELARPLTVQCTNACRTSYDACLVRALSDTEACLCRNRLTICVRSCGSPGGGLELCP